MSSSSTKVVVADGTITTTDLEREIFAKFEVDYNIDKINQGISALIESERINHERREEAAQQVADAHLQVLGRRAQLASISGKAKVKCLACDNEDPREFIEFSGEARMTCKRCGAVAKESMLFEGEWVRQYEGETNPSQHGPPRDDRLSDQSNLSTSFAHAGLFASAGTKTHASDNAKLQKLVEKGSLENAEVGQRTLIATKDNEKREVFRLIDEAAEALALHLAVANDAKTLFAHYRDVHETVHNRPRWIALSLVLAQRRLRENELAAQKRTAEEASTNSKKRERGSGDEAVNQFVCKGCDTGFSNMQSLRFHKLKECPATVSKRVKLDQP